MIAWSRGQGFGRIQPATVLRPYHRISSDVLDAIALARCSAASVHAAV